MGDADDFVIDPEVADWVWNHIDAQARLFWPADEGLDYLVTVGLDDQHYQRSGDYDAPRGMDWDRIRSRMPVMQESPIVPFRKGNVNSVRLAGVAYSTIGSWYTFEAVEDRPGTVDFRPVRVPVPEAMIDEVRSWADDIGGEVERTKGVEFQERFAEALPGDRARRVVREMVDVHVVVEGVDTETAFKSVIQDATDYAARGVRMAAR